MDQISPPMRIALAAVLAFAGLWFIALRPKPIEDVAVDPAPPVQSAPAKAADAVAKSNGTSAAKESSAKGQDAAPATKPKAAAAAKPAAAATATKPAATANATKPAATANAAKPATKPAVPVPGGTGAKKVLADLDRGRAVVLLFWDGRSSDDRYVRDAVKRVDRRDGKVRVHVAKVAQVARYEAVTKGLPMSTSPMVLVIDPKRRAVPLAGLTLTSEIDELAGRALKLSR